MRALTDGKTKIGAQLFPDRKRPAICVQKGKELKGYEYLLLSRTVDKCEVVGNIFDNPELLSRG